MQFNENKLLFINDHFHKSCSSTVRVCVCVCVCVCVRERERGEREREREREREEREREHQAGLRSSLVSLIHISSADCFRLVL